MQWQWYGLMVIVVVFTLTKDYGHNKFHKNDMHIKLNSR